MRRMWPQESGKEKEKEPVTILFPPKNNVILLLQFLSPTWSPTDNDVSNMSFIKLTLQVLQQRKY